jgi:hypothetical protein
MRHPGAGAIKVRDQYNEHDRFRDQMLQRKKEYEKKRKGLGGLIRKDGGKDKEGKPIERSNPDTMTKTMKVHTPGTSEYEKKRQAMIQHIESKQRKPRLKNSQTAYSQTTGSTLILTKESLPYRKDVRKPTFARKQAERLPVIKRFVKMTAEEELILDATVSLVAGLETGVFMEDDKELDMDKRRALKAFLDLLSVSLPPEWGIHKLIDDLRSKILFIARSDNNLKIVLNQHPLPRKAWSKSCTFNKKGPIGFSCGFWKLMHVVSVGVAEHRGGLNLVDSGMVSPATKIFSPIEAADTLRNYIEHFFTCAPCKNNFLKHYDDCENNRRCDRLSSEDEDATTADWKEFPVWLWEVHNEVSVRIVKQKVAKLGRIGLPGSASATSPHVSLNDEVRVVWPNIDNCFMCFEDDGTWDEEQVFKFLEKSYWYDKLLRDARVSSIVSTRPPLTCFLFSLQA